MINRFSIAKLADTSVMSSTVISDKSVMHRVKKSGFGGLHLESIVRIATLGLMLGCALTYGTDAVAAKKAAKAAVAKVEKKLDGYITNKELEKQYGISITLIAVTAQGGIVDFRYKVVDPTKAAALLHDPANTPVLTAMDSGNTLSPTGMSKHHRQMRMKRGSVPYSFYPNVRGAVKTGTLVSVAFGKIKVEPIAAK
jgi:hypothetical protein